jgi:hypothetical protein
VLKVEAQLTFSFFISVPCDFTLFSGSFGRRLGTMSPPPPVMKVNKEFVNSRVNTGSPQDDEEQRNLAWFRVNNGKCVCMAGEKWQEPELDKFQGNWYDAAVQQLVDNGTVENIASQKLGESLVCRCGQSPSSSTSSDGTTYEQDKDGIYVIPSNQYPCRCEDQEEFFGKRDRQIRNRRLKTGGKGQQQATSGGKGQQQGDNNEDADSTCKAKIRTSTFLCPPISRS